ncbi:anti-sigma factor antagonist [Embleya scabrispora]|uniref:STAS domain-containing protein n=1 Tax=Embleya scabrispora TaxID=159449 RepID=UPI000475ECBE
MGKGQQEAGMQGGLTVSVSTNGTSAIVTVAGEIDVDSADAVRDRLFECVEQGSTRLVIDCSELDFCDSTGLNAFLGARLRAQAAGGAVHLVGVQPAVARVFEITGAVQGFTFHETLAEAVGE